MTAKITLPPRGEGSAPDPYDEDRVLTRVLDALRRQEDARHDRERDGGTSGSAAATEAGTGGGSAAAAAPSVRSYEVLKTGGWRS